MILQNLFRRKGRTTLTLVGISIGVAAIVALGAVAQGLQAGFSAMTRGSQADFVLTQANAMSTIVSTIDETVADQLRTWPEVADLDGGNLRPLLNDIAPTIRNLDEQCTFIGDAVGGASCGGGKIVFTASYPAFHGNG